MKRVCLWLILLVLVGLVGCSSQDFGRPIARIGDVVDSGQAYVEDSDSEEVGIHDGFAKHAETDNKVLEEVVGMSLERLLGELVGPTCDYGME